MSSCNGNCSSCGSNCSERKAESLLAQLNPKASVKKVIAVVSGKGGVGKSTVTSMLAVGWSFGCRYHRPFHPHSLRRHQVSGRR